VRYGNAINKVLGAMDNKKVWEVIKEGEKSGFLRLNGTAYFKLDLLKHLFTRKLQFLK
jgi:hypothetical protein